MPISSRRSLSSYRGSTASNSYRLEVEITDQSTDCKDDLLYPNGTLLEATL